MKSIFLTFIFCTCVDYGGALAQPTASRQSSAVELKKMLTPSDTPQNLYAPSFEVPTEVPTITIQNLPLMQSRFRVSAVKAVGTGVIEAARVSMMTYSNEAPENGWRRVLVNRKRSLFGENVSSLLLRIDHEEKVVEIAIRGTVSLDDVLRDLDAKATFDDTLKFPLHSGFRMLAIEILNELKKKYLNEELLNTYSFKLYGHSLGGSIAAILAMYLHEGGSVVSSLVTFGAPRFTTNEGARKYQVLNQVTHRVVRCDDVVPFMPPPNFFGWSTESYQANGNLFLLLAPPYFDYSVGIDIERDFAYQLRIELANGMSRDALAFGHRMQNYENLLGWFGSHGLALRSLFSGGEVSSAGRDIFELRPVSYTLALQNKLCPPKLLR